MNDFWISSGHHLLDRGREGGLHVTDEFLKLYLARPEILPPPDACAVEMTLHASLLADPRLLLSAELFFRTQRVTLHEGALLVADEETVGGNNPGPVTPLVSMLGIPRDANIDIINKDNAGGYWERSDRFDMVLDLTTGREGLDALAKAMQRWIVHVIGVEVSIEAL